MVVSLAGEWDIYRQEELRRRLERAYDEAEVIFDLSAAKYVTSTFICALLEAHRYRTERGLPPAMLAVRSAFVRRLLTATGVDECFPIYESVAHAVRSLRETAAEESA